ncbi:MAG TPA: hypothetical protein VMP03_06475, partial [Methylomirabilota bacterium]|nr:hypothetical protein [Methylomirabilota bacterium]
MLIRQTLLYLPAQFLAPAAQLASMIVWTWWLAPAEMGVFALTTATQELAYLATLSWLSVYVLRYLPGLDDAAGRARYLGTETTVMLLAVLPQVLAAAVTVALIDGMDGAGMIAAVAAYFVTRSANVHYAERARAQTRIVAYTVLQAAGPVGGLVAGLAAMTLIGPTAEALLLAYAAAQALAILVALPMIGVSVRPRRPAGAVLRGAFAYGGPVLVLSGLGWMAENNIRYVVEHAAGAAAFGLLAVGWGLGRRAASFAAMLVAAAAFPLAARLINAGNRDTALNQLATNAALLCGVLFPAVAGLAMVGDGLVDLAVAEPYRETTKAVLALSALSGAIHFLHVHVTGQLFILERRFAFAAVVDTVEVVATVGLTALGLSTYGLVGAVAGAAAGSAIAGALSMVLAAGPLGFRFPLPDAARIALATAAMAAVLALLPETTSA